METVNSSSGICHRHVIKATYEAMRDLRGIFKEGIISLGLGTEDVHNWLVVFSEALNNAIEHGARKDPSQNILIRWGFFNDIIELVVTDPGLGMFANDKMAFLSSRGYGLRLMQSFCDYVEHNVNPAGGHTVVLSKRNKVLAKPVEMEVRIHKFLPVLAEFYSGLVFPMSAKNVFSPIFEFMTEYFGKKVLMELRVIEEYTKIASKFPFYRGNIPCEYCEICSPIQKTAIYHNEEGNISCFPLRLGKRALGSMMVYGLPRDNESLRLMENICTCITLALANERLQEHQKNTNEAISALKVAANLQSRQRQLKAATKDFIGTVYAYETRAEAVAGDIIECANAPDGGRFMLIADVMGKGVAAALLGGVFRGGWHLLHRQQPHPLMLVNEMNQFLYDELNGQSMFVTSALAHLSPGGEMISIVNAGHTPIYLQRPDGSLCSVESSGPPLGLFVNARYQLTCLRTSDFSRLYMPTDGLYCFGQDALHFDHLKLEDIFKNFAHKNVDDLWKTLQSQRESADEVHSDDQSLLVWEKGSKRQAVSSP